jgi:hypothetical protein
VFHKICNLQTFYNPNPGTPEEQDENELLEAALYTKHVPKHEKIFQFQGTALLFTNNNPGPPKTFNETKQTQDSANWWSAMTTELQSMEQKKVWEVLHRTLIPVNQKLNRARWVYTKKEDG